MSISDNWINGGGYSIQVRDREDDFGFPMPTNITVTDNLFGRDAQFGNIIIDGNVADTNNRFEDTNEIIMENNASGVLSTNNIEETFNGFYVLDNKKASYQIFNTTSNLLLNGAITSNNFNIKMNALSSGVYFIKVSTAKGLSTKTIIKNNQILT